MTNVLLFLILVVLLFGAGTVMGFFSTVFWIVFWISIAILVWKISAITIEDEKKQIKEGFDKHPYIAMTFWAFALAFLIFVVGSYIVDFSTDSNPVDNSGVKVTPLNTNTVQTKQHIDEKNTQIVSYQYPNNVRSQFLTSCNENATDLDIDTELITGYCRCSLNFIQERYSFEEFAKAEIQYVQTGQLPELMVESAEYCLNQIQNENQN